VFNARTLAYVRTIGGGEGEGPGQLSYPYGICIGDVLSPSNTGTSSYSMEYAVFVVEQGNNRVSVFNAASGSFIRTVGSGVRGSGPGQLNNPLVSTISLQEREVVTPTATRIYMWGIMVIKELPSLTPTLVPTSATSMLDINPLIFSRPQPPTATASYMQEHMVDP
jgi:hypothetical protein